MHIANTPDIPPGNHASNRLSALMLAAVYYMGNTYCQMSTVDNPVLHVVIWNRYLTILAEFRYHCSQIKLHPPHKPCNGKYGSCLYKDNMRERESVACVFAQDCPLCHDPFVNDTDSDSCPMQIGCGHTICKACHHSLLLSDQDCPLCKGVPSDTTSEPVPNLLFSRAVPTHPRVFSCGPCIVDGEITPAVYMCNTCSMALCEPDHQKHVRRGHYLTTIKRPRISNDISNVSECPCHQMPILSFCPTCYSLACATCADTHAHALIPIKEAESMVTDKLAGSITNISETVACLKAMEESCTLRKLALSTSMQASLQAFDEACTSIVTAAETLRASIHSKCEKALKARLKDIDATADCIDISVSQLEFTKRTAISISADGRISEMAGAQRTIERALKLNTSVHRRMPPIDVVFNPVPVLDAIESMAYVRLLDISPQDTRITGSGLRKFVYGSDSEALLHNSVTVECVDEKGTLAELVTPANIRVTIAGIGHVEEGANITLHPTIAVSPGMLGFQYTVGRGISVVAITVTVLDGRPFVFHASSGYTGVGNHLSTTRFASAPGTNARGLAISPDGLEMFISDMDNDRISVYSVGTGTLLRSFGKRGVGPTEFNGPIRLVISSNGTLLVSELRNHRVQEVSLAGKHLSFINVDECIGSIDANSRILVVGKSTRITDCLRVDIFDMCTRKLVRQFGKHGTAPGFLSNCNSIRLSPGGTNIIYSENENRRISIFDVMGKFIRILGNNSLITTFDAAYTALGEVVVADGVHNRLAVFRPRHGDMARTTGSPGVTDGSFSCPTALCVHGSSLYVLDGKSGGRVQCFD
jgi:DNA-binding beta-propeller fold protein YncE